MKLISDTPEDSLNIETILNNEDNESYKKAINYCEKNLFNEALNIIENLIKKYPSEYFLYEFQAMIFKKLEKIDRTIDMMEKVVELKPDYAEAYLYLADIYRYRKDIKNVQIFKEKALLAYDKRMLKKSFMDDAIVDKSILLKELYGSERAIEYVQKIIDENLNEDLPESKKWICILKSGN